MNKKYIGGWILKIFYVLVGIAGIGFSAYLFIKSFYFLGMIFGGFSLVFLISGFRSSAEQFDAKLKKKVD